jgi:uncharacterized protein (TIGR03086 family)
MSDVLLRYQRVSEGFGSRLLGLKPGQLSLPTPCSDWDVRTLVVHVIDTHWRVEGTPEREADPAGDLMSQWSDVTAAVQTALADPETSATLVGGMFGERSFASLVDSLLSADTLFHTWDLARATSQDEELDKEAVTQALAYLTPLDEAIRRPGGFGPKIDSTPGADVQTRFLNFGGRAV